MRSGKPIRSPLFYVGDKYKLMPQLSEIFPSEICRFVDVFCGGGSASLNTSAKEFVLNDVNPFVVELHRFLQRESRDIEGLISALRKSILNYGLSHSELGTSDELEKLKKEFKKTYFSHYNKSGYLRLREDFNDDQSRTDLLYLLLIYGFNHMIRFNSSGQFNLPVGNVDWNKNVSQALRYYAEWANNSKVTMSSPLDFQSFVRSLEVRHGDFFYFDPPYLISFSDYNKLWNEETELRLYSLLDDLSREGVRWGLSNLVSHKGKTNNLLADWSRKYSVKKISSNYISRFDNTQKSGSYEVYVFNY